MNHDNPFAKGVSINQDIVMEDVISRVTVLPYKPDLNIDPLSDNWRKDGVVIYERNNRELLALGREEE